MRALILLWLAGLSLRVTVLALPPVLDRLVSAFGIKPVDVGVLTAIPAFFFAAAAIPGAALIRRIGAPLSLLCALILTALGASARAFSPGTLALEATTAAMSLGVALAQPAMAVLVKAWTPQRIGLASATYTFGLLAGEIVPVTFPIRAPLSFFTDAWRSQLFLWALPVAATVAAIAFMRPRSADAEPGYAFWPDWGSRRLWWVGLLMGSVGATYFGLNGFIPSWLARAGRAEDVGVTLMVLNVAQLPAALIMLAAAERLAFKPWVYVVAAIMVLLSSMVLATGFGHLEVFAAAAAGFSLAVLLALVMTLQPMVADERGLPALSAGAFTIGFGMAVVVALLTGWLQRSSAGLVSVVPIAAACAILIGFGGTIRTIRNTAE